jgi:hypothetical protein
MGGGVLWGERSLPGLLQRPWTYFILGAALVLVGAVLFTTTHPAHPVRIDSHVADYQLETKDGKYFANHLKLAGDSTDYVFDRADYQPAPPDTMQANAPITIWVDQGGTMVLAIDINGQTYSKPSYRDPNVRVTEDRLAALVLGAIGVVLIAIGFLVGRLMNRRPPPPPPVPETERYNVPEGRGRLVQ